jgi:hypothetical protein
MKNSVVYLPLLSIGALTISFVELSFYYEQFDIDFTSYYSVSDLVFSNGSVFLALLLIMMGGAQGIFIYQYFRNLKYGVRAPLKLVPSRPDWDKTEPLSRKDIGFFFLLFLLTLFMCYPMAISKFFEPPYNIQLHTTLTIVVYTVVNLFVAYAMPRIAKRLNIVWLEEFIIATLALSSILICLKLSTELRGKNCIYGEHRVMAKLILNDGSMVQSNKQMVLVGSNTNYYFFIKTKNSRLEESIIIPSKEVSRAHMWKAADIEENIPVKPSDASLHREKMNENNDFMHLRRNGIVGDSCVEVFQ